MLFSFLIVDPGTAILAAGAGSVLSSLFGSIFGSSSSQDVASTNLRAVRETNAANRRLAEYQNAEALRRWNMENEYNTPAAQMERYKAAGLNPYIMQASGAQNVSANMPAVQRAQMQAYQQTENPGAYIASGMQNIGAQIQQSTMSYYNAEAQKAQIMKTLSDTKGQDILNAANRDYLALSMKKSIEQMDSNIQKQVQEVQNLRAQETLTKMLAKHEDKKILETLERVKSQAAQTKLTIAQEKNESKRYGLIEQEIRNAAAQLGLIHSQTYANYMAGRLSASNTSLIQEQLTEQVYRNRLRRVGVNPDDTSFGGLITRLLIDPEAFQQVNIPKNIATLISQIKDQYNEIEDLLPKDKSSWFRSWNSGSTEYAIHPSGLIIPKTKK